MEQASEASIRDIAIRKRRSTIGCRVNLSLEQVAEPLLELMVAAPMIEMTVGRYTDHRPFTQSGNLRSKRTHAHTGIDEHIAIPASYMPYVAANEGVDVGLLDQRDPIAQRVHPKPAIGNFECAAHLLHH